MLKNLLRRLAIATRQDEFIVANRGCISTGGVLDRHLFDFALAHLLLTVHAPVIVQVGANTGDTSHDMREQLVKSGATALLVEPQPGVFETLAANYAEVPSVKLANVALSHSNGTQNLYRISEYANQFHRSGKVFGNSIASFDKDHPWDYFLRNATDAGKNEPKEKIVESVAVRCQTFNDLLKENNLTRMDVLAVDTEGFDFEVVKMALGADLFPSLIKYEHKHLPGGLDEARASWQFVAERGYQLVVVKATGDTVAWKTNQ